MSFASSSRREGRAKQPRIVPASYLKLKIVPEYVTWYPSLGVGNANWNNDANWHRSNSAELYKSDYTNYQAYQTNASLEDAGTTGAIPTINNYVPMKFTKVTIADLQGLPSPTSATS